MALKKKPVTGMKDMLPAEMEIRDYVIQMIKDTYRTFGFSSMETPCVEHIENLCSKQGGDNEKLIFKILKRGEKLKLDTAKEEMDLVDGGLRYDLTVQVCCRHRLKRCRWGMCGERTDRKEDVSVSLCNAISTFLVNQVT